MTDVVVIGAGSAGMTAAYRLSQAGVNVTVVEARARVGGRTWSEVLSNGEVAERGGEYFESSMVDVHDLAEDLGLTMTTQGFNPTVRPTNDPLGPSLLALEEASRQVVDYWTSLSNITIDTSIQDIVDGARIDSGLAAVLTARMACHRSALVSEVSALWSEGPPSAQVEYEHHTRILGGNQLISERMADRVGRDNLLFRWPVASITREGTRYKITNLRGETLYGDAIVVAVPISIARTLEIEGLDPRTREAQLKLGFGAASKLHLTVENDCAPGIRQDVAHPYSSWAAAAVGRATAGFVTGFAATRDTQLKLSVADGPQRFRPLLEKDWPGVSFGPDTLFTNWGADPWTRGAYSFRPLGWTEENDEFISAPSDRVFFAGEHTADLHRSLICGAIRSGNRAAKEVIERIGRP